MREAVAVARRSLILRELDELAKRLEEIVPSIGLLAKGRGRGSQSCAQTTKGPGSSSLMFKKSPKSAGDGG